MIILGVDTANGRWQYIVTSSLVGWTHTQNYPRLVKLRTHNATCCVVMCKLWYAFCKYFGHKNWPWFNSISHCLSFPVWSPSIKTEFLFDKLITSMTPELITSELSMILSGQVFMINLHMQSVQVKLFVCFALDAHDDKSVYNWSVIIILAQINLWLICHHHFNSLCPGDAYMYQ